jgi:hypothetical protein
MSYSLRDLPLPVKVVVSVFLMAVGVGYTSAMVQLHVQDAKSGKPMPTVEDVIRKYTGKKKFDPHDTTQQSVSRLEALVTCPTVAISGNSMSGAFTTDDRAKGDLKFHTAIKGKTPEQVAEIKAQRAGEQEAFRLWINTSDDQRKAAHGADKFVPPAGKTPKTITAAFKDGDAIKIKSIIDNRCVTCHSKGKEKEDVLLDTYDGLAVHMKVDVPTASGEWVKVEEPISITKLTQSTHAHLLSFAMLFSLTGLVFAFSSYPTKMRCVLGPWVVLAVFADVSLWWLARLCDEWGPYFAMGIIFTGAIAGIGLGLQITLSLFNMYGRKGKVVVALLFVLGGAIAGLVTVNKIVPALENKPDPNPIQSTEPPTTSPPPKPDEAQRKKEIGQAWEDLKSTDAAKKQAAQQTLDRLVTEALRKRIEDAQKRFQSDQKEIRDAARAELQQLKIECGIADAKFGAVMLERWLIGVRLSGAVPMIEPGPIEQLLAYPVWGPDGKLLSMSEVPFTGGDEGNMARAFFDKETAYKGVMNNGPKEKWDELHANRNGEREALIAWARSADPARRAAYEKDGFVRPPYLAGDPISPEYVKGNEVLIKKLITDRCARCHSSGSKQEDYPLTTYDEIRKYLNPPLPAAKP